MKAKRIYYIVLCMGLVSMLTGCLNGRELNELAIVTGIGMDKVPDSDEYRVTFQVVNPSATATSTGSSTSDSTVFTYSSVDRTIFGALRKTSKKASRQLFFAHTQLVVIGEELARSGLETIFDIFERAHELRLTSSVLVARDTDAGSVLKVLIPVEKLPAVGLAKKTRNTAKLWGESRNVNVFEVINTVMGEGDLSISGVRITGETKEGMNKSNLEQSEVKSLVLMSGLGFFEDGKLKGWVEGAEARGALWIQNKIKETSININTEENKAVAINLILSKTKIKADVQQGVPVLHVSIKEEGNVIETQGYVDLSKREEIMKLETKLEEKTEAEVIEAFEAAKRLNCDVFRFADELKRTHPKEWEKVGKNWDKLFAQAKLDVQVEAYILSTGMRLKPYLPE
jgi:spore germination protein KC